ncbi:MAG: hypothetical protein PV362_04370, partial [Providencia heimbachae]|nr:hypothetical protein [Providencia heimbachae]
TTWKVYRDAVAQAGTGPAFKQIAKWIQSKKLKGEEAAEIISTLPRTVRTPTDEYLEQFFVSSNLKQLQLYQIVISCTLTD